MKITVKTAALTSEQMKFLSQLGEFGGANDETWVGGCDWEDFWEAVELLRRAGVDDLSIQFGE
jgi:hypothetical protein